MKNKVYYYRKNRKNRRSYHIRKAPETVTQTTATKKAATDFGDASKSSKLLRDALQEHTRLCADNRHHCRLNKTMAEILRADVNHPAGQRILTADNMPALKHFKFNIATNTHQLLKSSPVIEQNTTGDISISFDGTYSNKSHALCNTTHITIKAIALYVNLTKGTTRKLESNTVLIKRGEEFAPVTININRRDLTLIMLEAQAFYEVNGQLHASQSKQAHALDIIEVLAPIAQPKEQKKKYRNKAPHFWLPYAKPAIPALIITPVNFNSLPEG
jgi:hypothetical protein